MSQNMFKVLLDSNNILRKGINAINELESKDSKSEDYLRIVDKLNKVYPSLTESNAMIWAGIFPDERLFLSVSLKAKKLVKIVYFTKTNEKTVIEFNAKGDVKSKETSSMVNYPRYYKGVREYWLEKFKEVNTSQSIKVGDNVYTPKLDVNEYAYGIKAMGKALMLNEEHEDRYNQIVGFYKTIFNKDITQYVLTVNGGKNEDIMYERGEWYTFKIID